MRRALCSLGLFCALIVPAQAAAQGGIPDPTFGDDGFASVSTSPSGERESGNAIAIDSQDRVLVGGIVNDNDPTDHNGGWMLVRFRSDGSLDTGFGEAGFARPPGLFGLNLAMSGQAIRALAIEPGSGKIIAGGMTIGPSKGSEFTVARYNVDGSLDMTFGPANTGFVTADFGSSSDDLQDIAVAADGSITAVGASGLDVGLARWDSDGAPSPTFDGPTVPGNGKFVDSVSATFDSFRSVSLGPAGEVRAVGSTADGSTNSWLVISYTATGARDTNFNGTGVQVVTFGGQSEVAAGQVLVGGVLYVFGNVDLNPDPKKSTLDLGVDAFRIDNGAELPGAKKAFDLADGHNLFDAGLQHLGGSPAAAAQRFLVVGNSSTLIRLRRVGGDSTALELDPEFGNGGIAPEPPGATTGAWGGVGTDSQNRIVAGGDIGLYTTADFSAARFFDIPAELEKQGAKDTAAPVITNASFTPRAWAVNPRGAVEALLSARAKPKKGTKIRYTLSEPAGLVVRVERRKVTRKGAKKRIRFVAIGSFAKAGLAGANTNPFSGKVGKKRLRPGRYRANLTATDAAGNASSATRLPFRVVSSSR